MADQAETDREQTLETQAAVGTRRGEEYEQNGQPDLAEDQFLLALKAQEQLIALSSEQRFVDAAAESCSSLADICMQQGNMHGADFYYARAMGYRQGIRFSAENSPNRKSQL